MSNPGVVTLAEAVIGKTSLRIEDNIGEAIHIHYGNIRLDLCINEFINFANQIIKIAERMIDVEDFSYKKYDAIFLSQVERMLLNLKKIEVTNVSVGELMTDTICKKRREFINIRESRVSKALDGDTEELEQWKQINYFGENNADRLEHLQRDIKERGYHPDKDGTYIVVCDGGRVIADGCHRASILLDIYGNIQIPIANWITDGNLWSDDNRDAYEESQKERKEKHQRYIDLLIQSIVERDLKNKKIIFKGAGRFTTELLKFMTDSCYQIVGIIAKEIKEESLKQYRCISEDEIPYMEADVIVVSSFQYRAEMISELRPYASLFEIYDLYDKGIDFEFFL